MESVSDFFELLRRVGDRLLDWIALLLYGPGIVKRMSRRFA